ncbi:hypothetical protein F4804DRAFT_296272 [Jackrogersella minutella]|nr:hypothetical protein F4804DRAFT_296272 [Jackrogersella minutella]
MSISRLPESTTRLLGSPLVITTPVSLVKELLDNSIDANASSIEIIISADTVKKIEVRDNGIGIHPDDYSSLGRRGHTSKLRSSEELKTNSSKTLGFRGEALASANSLAKVTITTKIVSEPVAAILHILPGAGGVSKQHPTSAPVGTTVSIAGLFSELPVREQVAIKDSAKSIDQISELLRSYAMARPQLRLSFRVLQSPKQNKCYSPRPQASIKEAAVQLFGAEIASQCFQKTFETEGPTGEDNTSVKIKDPLLNGRYVFEGFILKPGSDPSKVPKQRYFSIDGRPVTAKRGTMKKLSNIYVEYLSAAFQQSYSAATIKNCFIRLNIKCPPGSYDANIEPSKDDVLFSDEELVIDGFKELCKEAYDITTPNSSDSQLPAENGSVSDGMSDTGAQGSLPIESQVESDFRGVSGFESSLPIRSRTISQSNLTAQSQLQQLHTAHEPTSSQLQDTEQHISSPVTNGFTPINTRPFATQGTIASSETPSYENILPNTRKSRYRVDMSKDFNEYSQDYPRKKRPRPTEALPSLQDQPDIVEYSAPQDVNPWIIARMHAPPNRNLEEQAGSKPVLKISSQLSEFEPPMTPDPPILRHTGAAPRDLDVPPSQRYLHSQDHTRQLLPRVPGGPYRSPMSSPSGIASQKAVASATGPLTLGRRRRDYPPWSPPSSTERTTPSSDYLVNAEHRPISDGMKQTTISFEGGKGNHKRRRIQEDNSEIDHQNSQDQEPCGESGLQRMLAAARKSLNHQLSQQNEFHNSKQEPPQSHLQPETDQDRRYAKLHVAHGQEEASSSNIREPIKTTLPGHDPRAYLLRRQKSMAAEEVGPKPKRLRRMKSSLLPLENVPSDDQTHSIVLLETLNVETLRTSMKRGVAYDRYVEKGAVKNGLEMNLDTGREVEARIRSLLQKQSGGASDEEGEWGIGLCSLLKGKGVAASA